MPALTCLVKVCSETTLRLHSTVARRDILNCASLSFCLRLGRVANLPAHLASWQGRFVATPLSHLLIDDLDGLDVTGDTFPVVHVRVKAHGVQTA